MGKKLTEAEKRAKRDEQMITLYGKLDKKGKKVYSVRKLADRFGISKSRVHEIVSTKS